MRHATAPAGPAPARDATDPVPDAGLCWWTNAAGVWPEAPRDAFGGAGAGQQVLLVVPSLALIAVRNGERLDEEVGASFWGGLRRRLVAPLLEAVR